MRRSLITSLLAGTVTVAVAVTMLPAQGLTTTGTAAEAADPSAETPAFEEPARVTEELAQEPSPAPEAEVETTPESAEAAEDALEAVEEALAGAHDEGDDGGHGHDGPDLSLALAGLATEVQHLSGAKRARAEKLLRAPDLGVTNSGSNERAASYRRCNVNLCVHYTTDAGSPHRTTDAWSIQVANVMQQVWSHHIGKLKYKAPRKDGNYAGTPQFDVVIADTKTELGAPGIYGFCSPIQGTLRKRTAAAFCVIENDFAEDVFQRQTALNNLRVTAAHEFFHAIQFAYDVLEDDWMKEATATWVEERFASDVNDNRQFFRSSQLSHPKRPLDSKRSVYGNWVWFEYLSTRFNNAIVRQIWQKSRTRKNFSVRSFVKVLKGKRGGFPANFARFSAVNTNPRIFYPEGSAWMAAKVQERKQVRRGNKKKRTVRFRPRVKQLGSYNMDIRVNPKGLKKGKKKKTRKRRLTIQVSGPNRKKSPAAHALIYLRNGKVKQKQIKLNKRGNGKIRVRVGRGNIRKVTVTVVNASSRFKNCRFDRGTGSLTDRACAGKPRDRNVRFVVRGTLQK